MTNVVKLLNLGRISYEKSNNLQKLLSKRHTMSDLPLTIENMKSESDKTSKRTPTSNVLLIMEHNPVYTTGLRDYLSQEDQIKLKSLGAEYYRTDRGGLVTFHGPGQLTAYPILNLRHYKPSVKWYVCRLEEIIIEMCKRMGITASRSPHTGVWVEDSKICALGVHVSRGITTHGLALNCCTDLKWFEHIVPCGIEGKGVTSLSNELDSTVSVNEALPLFLQCFEDVFKSRLLQSDETIEELFSQIE